MHPFAGMSLHHMDPAPMSPRLRGSFFANAGVSEEIRQEGIKRTWLGLVILNFVSHLPACLASPRRPSTATAGS